MPILDLIFGEKTKARIGIIQFDASLNEVHGKTNEVTEHPIELGSNVADHIRVQPETIEINGVVSNTPIVFLASQLAESPNLNSPDKGTGNVDRVDVAYQILKANMDNGVLLDVVTSLRTYSNMAITAFSVTRDAQNGNVLNANLSLRQVVIVKTETVEAPVREDPSQNKQTEKNRKQKRRVNDTKAQGYQRKTSILRGGPGF